MHVIQAGSLAVAARPYEAIDRGIPPRTQTEVSVFLGRRKVYRLFVPTFSQVVRPLNGKLGNDQAKKFDDPRAEETEMVEALKTTFVTVLLLGIPPTNFTYTLEMDSRNLEIRCVPMQDEPDDASMVPLGNWASTLNKSEQIFIRRTASA